VERFTDRYGLKFRFADKLKLACAVVTRVDVEEYFALHKRLRVSVIDVIDRF